MENFRLKSALLLFIFSIASHLVIGVPRDTYVAAVVEFQPVQPTTAISPEYVLESNSDKYVQFIAEAKTYNVDIIVFPEYGLTSLHLPKDRIALHPFLFPLPPIGEAPCFRTDSHPILRKLSCAANTHQIYAVLNLAEIEVGSEGAGSGCRRSEGDVCHYNTNLVFNRNGEIIAKYHKFNLYFENEFNVPLRPEPVTFDTDFGVTFGTFTCFDIMFEAPAINLVRNGIRNFVITMAWVDELPFLTATQTNTIWGMSAGANLLVSGYHQPGRGTLGSGIFSSSAGALNYTFDPKSGSQLIISEVPIIPYSKPVSTHLEKSRPENSFSDFVFLNEDLRNYSIVPLDMVKSEAKVCHNDLCCTVHYRFQEFNASLPYGLYKIAAFSGLRKTARETAEFGWEVCGVTRYSWANLEYSKTTLLYPMFKNFRLRAKGFRIEPPLRPGLSTLDTNFQPIPLRHIKLFRKEKVVKAQTIDIRKVNLHTLALVNRIF